MNESCRHELTWLGLTWWIMVEVVLRLVYLMLYDYNWVRMKHVVSLPWELGLHDDHVRYCLRVILEAWRWLLGLKSKKLKWMNYECKDFKNEAIMHVVLYKVLLWKDFTHMTYNVSIWAYTCKWMNYLSCDYIHIYFDKC